ncbi:hypothetical protein RF11_16226 [Thelohanellus kitauei]|uniref:Uncharacterized protein n=1 Tax=Thelohanellus kitauei TaxID=669202 RepID=A0A0C2J018_THEKT|nr:hypothetical protein RF11_16226 [Thelohanellus kitauei]
MFLLTGTSTLAHTFKDVMIYTSNKFVEGCLRLSRDHLHFTGGGYTISVPYLKISYLGVCYGSEVTEGPRLPSKIFHVNDEGTPFVNLYSVGDETYAFYHESCEIVQHIVNVINGLIDIMQKGQYEIFFDSDGSESIGVQEDADSGYETEQSIQSLYVVE